MVSDPKLQSSFEMGMPPIRRAFVILFFVALVVALGLALAQDQTTLRLRSAYSADHPQYPSYIAALSGADSRRGNDYDVLVNGDQIFPAMLAAINAARQRISFETYIYDSGQVANQFTDALEAAAKRGVHVRIVVDSLGSSSMEEAHAARLRAAGCRLAQFNPVAWYSLEHVNYRSHRKILVVDGEVGFTGGVGVADHWLGNGQDKEHWRETHVRIRGPIVRLLEAAFYENFGEASGPEAPEFGEEPGPASGDHGPSIVVRSSPTGGGNDLKRLYLLALASARRTVDITSPYFVTDESTRWSFEHAVSRGVKIRILVEGDITDAMPVKYASRAHYEQFLERGIEIYEYQPTMMHTKVMVVDGVWSMFGSANFDNRSLELNDELNVAVTSRGVAERFLNEMANDLRVSRRLTLESWRQRGLLNRTREKFWQAFGEVF
jgi:cardiolipin synthase